VLEPFLVKFGPDLSRSNDFAHHIHVRVAGDNVVVREEVLLAHAACRGKTRCVELLRDRVTNYLLRLRGSRFDLKWFHFLCVDCKDDEVCLYVTAVESNMTASDECLDAQNQRLHLLV